MKQLSENEVNSLLNQIIFFNHKFHMSENDEKLKPFHSAMRKSKDCCQLLLMKFSPPHLISIYPDLSSQAQDWIISSSSRKMGTHIPLETLKKNLSCDLLNFWNIN